MWFALARFLAPFDMAPSNETLEKYLKDATRRLYKADPNTVTVNSVRQDAQERNGLENGFFVTPEWKSRSKALITGFVVCYVPVPAFVRASWLTKLLTATTPVGGTLFTCFKIGKQTRH